MTLQEHSHNPEDISARLHAGPRAIYLREWVYGGIDGVVTTFAIIAAVVGAGLSPLIVIILGLANLVGDGFSMAAGAYSATKTEADNYTRLRKIEEMHVRKYPEGEREETRQIFANKGFSGDDLEKMVQMISKDENVWIDFMLAEEYGVSKPIYTPAKAGLNTFFAFLLCGSMPLLPFLTPLGHKDVLALVLAGLTFFAIGSFKSLWGVKVWWREGLETLSIGMTAAGLAYAIGYGLKNLGTDFMG